MSVNLAPALIKNTSLRKIGILGLGRTGLAALKLATDNHINSFIYDDNHELAPAASISLFKPYTEWPWHELDAVIFSPGIPTYLPAPHPAAILAQKHHVSIISDIELVIRLQPESKWVVITGTNGKSTTTALTAHILQHCGKTISVGGNIGTSMAELDSPGINGIRIVELSSYQLEITPSLNPDIAAILNLSPDHLERHGSMEKYAAAKANAVQNVKPDGLIILGQSPNLQPLLPAKHTARLHLIMASDTPKTTHQNFALSGAHNAENAAVAATICREFGATETDINEAILSFKGLSHRLELVASVEIDGHQIRMINDSKATNDAAAAKALASFEHIFWCAGGLAKENSLPNCISELAHVEHAYLYGDSKNLFEKELSGLIPITVTHTLEEATTKAFVAAKKAVIENNSDSFVLLSPAAASFDSFKNFEERGKYFCDLAVDLCQQHSLNTQVS
ncbi:UDP-N-acetylmuramoyl-L-alanine--D-glutamate ligase [Alphaproteobacteria bacterium]|nr:UDP-N-acetylmuramoyl-L-alanine--D-glutamate ligase [Alphaproteobacteria bacterium]